jgi:hypothetical protein
MVEYKMELPCPPRALFLVSPHFRPLTLSVHNLLLSAAYDLGSKYLPVLIVRNHVQQL